MGVTTTCLWTYPVSIGCQCYGFELIIYLLVTATNILNGNEVAVANKILNGKRDLVSVNLPITIQDILNCNNIEIANDLLNGLAKVLGCTVAQLGITAQDILGAKTEADGIAIVATLQQKLSRRDLLDLDLPSRSAML